MKTVKGMTTRPTADRVKESLFNIMAPYIAGSDILDLFAGTGSLGIEALSRGAGSAVFVDRSRECCDIINENLLSTGLKAASTVIRGSFETALEGLVSRGYKFDIVFLDPPYNKNFIQDTLKLLAENDIIRDGGILTAEHHIGDELPELAERLKRTDTRKYGDTMLSIYTALPNRPGGRI